MSFKRIAVLCTAALGAVALVGGGYAAAQTGDSPTTLISSPSSSSTEQPYNSGTASTLNRTGVALLAASYQAGCGTVSANNTTVTVTITGAGAGTPTGSVTFGGHAGSGTNPATLNSEGKASYTYNATVAGQTITFDYGGDPNYFGCSGTYTFAKATPTSCDVTRNPNKKVLTMTVVGSAGTPTGSVRFFDNADGTTTYVDRPAPSGTASRDYGINAPGTVKVTYLGNDTYDQCSFQSVNN